MGFLGFSSVFRFGYLFGDGKVTLRFCLFERLFGCLLGYDRGFEPLPSVICVSFYIVFFFGIEAAEAIRW